MNKNILVQYDGGGYDGCIWEWNFFYIDSQGKFEDIFSSGCGGIETKEKAMDLLENNSNKLSSRVYVYHLDKNEDLIEFAKETHSGLVAMIVRWFNDYNMPDIQPFAICEDCGCCIEDIDEINVEYETLRCYECYALGSCSYCGEYYGQKDEDMIFTAEQIKQIWDLPKDVAQSTIENYAPLCIYCAEQLLNEQIDTLIKKTKS